MVLAHEGSVAVRALEGSLPSVIFDVFGQVIIGIECFVTLSAFVWPFSTVHSEMDNKTTLARKSLATYIT